MPENFDQLSCIDCGAAVDADQAVAERTFAVTPEVVLCNACAVRRGGVYDDADDKWKVAPRLEGVAPEERTPHP